MEASSRCVDDDPRGVFVPSGVRFADLSRLLRKHNWELICIRGSHHVFRRPDGSTYSVPVHHGKVKAFYSREIKKQIGED
jgi:predicted RNA binding protein YcfA (HicA-like mRNA interferase family)